MRLPLATDLVSRDGTTDKDAKIVNGFVEVNGDQPIVRKRFGYNTYANLGAGNAQLLTYFNNTNVAVVSDICIVGGDSPGFSSGETWTSIGTGESSSGYTVTNYRAKFCVVEEDRVEVIYSTRVVTATGKVALVKSTDGRRWSVLNTDCTGSTSNAANYSIVVDPDNGYIYLLASQVVFRSVDGGLNFTNFSTYPTGNDRPNILKSGSNFIVYGGETSGTMNHAIYTSTDMVSWTSQGTITDGNYTTQALVKQGTAVVAICPSASNLNYTVSLDDGENWTTQYDVAGYTGANITIGSFAGVATETGYAIWFWDSSDLTELLYLDALAHETAYSGITMDIAYDATQHTSLFVNDVPILAALTSSVNAYSGDIDIYSGTTVPLTPDTASLIYSAQANGANAQSLLFIKNSQQAWTLNTSNVVTDITSANYPGNYAVTLVSLTRSGTTATATLSADTNFQVGSTVTIAGATPSTYNGAQVITSVTPSVSASEGIAITITRSGTTATATVATEPHGFVTGQTVTIVGANQTEYNGAKVITVTSATAFTFTVTVTTGGPASPATGTISLNVYNNSAYTGTSMAATLSGSTLTITTVAFGYETEPYGIAAVGESVVISGAIAYNGTYSVASVTPGANGIYTYTVTVTPTATISITGKIFKSNPVVSGITRSGNYATVTTTGNVLPTVTYYPSIAGAEQTQYNQVQFSPIYISTTSFKYYVITGADSPVSPATGTITASGTAASGPSFTFTIAGSPSTPATGTITATGGRNTVPGVAYMDGYFFVMDIYGVIYNSDLNSPGTWNALDYITAESQTGNGKALAKSLNYIVAFKEWSTEFFYNAGNTNGSPLDRVDNGFTLIGCASGESLAELEGSLLWVSQSRGEGRGVYAMQGIQQAKISTPDIERILNEDDLATVYAYGIKIDGHALYVLTLITSDITLVYDATTKTWAQWSSLTAGSPVSVSSITQTGGIATVTTSAAHGMSDGDPATIAGATQSGYNGTVQIRYLTTTTFEYDVDSSTVTPATGTITVTPYTESYFKLTHYAYCGGDNNLALHRTNGLIYNFDESLPDDNNVPINLLIRTAKIDDGTTANKVMGKLEVIGNKADTSLMIRWTNDDYVSYSAFRSVDLNNDRSQLRRCGDFRRRAIELRHVDDVAVQLGSLEI